MAKTDFNRPADYIATFPPDVQAVLDRVRDAIRRAVPEVEEGISYQMLAFKFHGRLCYVGAYQQHYSLFGFASPTLEAFAADLAPHLTPKGAVQFPLGKPVPVRLISALAKHQARANLAQRKQTAKR